ncbi:hypothetical protein CF319_g3655 [Tilletia indica]|nr:hypothetical protein CF319_g3655 [Tilletia indica]
MSASETEDSFMNEDHSNTMSAGEIEDSSMHEDDSNRRFSSSDEQAIGKEERSDTMSPSDDEVVPDRIEYRRMLSWPEHISAPSDIIVLFNEVAASMPPYSHPTQDVLFFLPEFVGKTGQTRLAGHYGEAFCRRMLNFIKLLLEHDRASATLGPHGTLHSILSLQLMCTERFYYTFQSRAPVNSGLVSDSQEWSLVERSAARGRSQDSMNRLISILRSDMVAAKRIIRFSFSPEANILRGSKLQKSSFSHPMIGARIKDIADMEWYFEAKLRDISGIGILHSVFAFIRSIKLPRDRVNDLEAAESGNDSPDGQGGTANSVTLENVVQTFSIDEIDIGPRLENPVKDAYVSTIFLVKGLEHMAVADKVAVEAWYTSALQAVLNFFDDLLLGSYDQLDFAVPKLLAVALALCQINCYPPTSVLIEIVVLGFRDKLQGAQSSETDRLNLINALGALTTIFREANKSNNTPEENELASLAAEEAIKILQPLYERDKATHRQCLAALKIEYGLCVLALAKRKVSALRGGRHAVKEAVELCREIITDNPTNWEAKLLLARALYVHVMSEPHHNDEFDGRKLAKEALDHLRDVVQMRPGPFDLQLADAMHSFAGLDLIESRSILSEAEAIYEALSAVTPGHFEEKLSETRHWLVHHHLLWCNYEAAEVRLTKLIEGANAYDSAYRREQVFLQIMSEKYKDSLKSASRSGKVAGVRNRANAKLLSEKGYCAWMLGDQTAALRDLQKSIEMTETIRKDAFRAFDDSSLHELNPVRGETFFDEYNNAMAWLGALQSAMGDQEAALRNGAEAVRLMRLSRACCQTEADILSGDLKLARVLVYWSAILLNAGRGQEASRSIDESIELMRSRARSDSAFKTALLMKERMLAEDGKTSEAANLRAEADAIPYEGFLAKLGRSSRKRKRSKPSE